MDIDTIDSEYRQLEQEAQETFQAIQALASKLQAADQASDPSAKEWLLDLKSIALQVQQEQLQMQTTLQALHGFVGNALQQPQMATQPTQMAAAQPAAAAQGGGMLQNFMGGGFGRAMEMGVGMGVGNQIIGSIFGNL
jgi:hypothetical protein